MKRIMNFVALACAVLLPCFTFASFKNVDFVGQYISYSSSAGGNTLSSPPPNAAITSVAQFSLNKDGTGVVNRLNVLLYPTTTTAMAVNYTDLPIVYTITDKELGTGSLTIEDYPVAGSGLVTFFVATKGASREEAHRGRKNKCSSPVTQIFLNTNQILGLDLFNASVILAQRQYQ